MQLVPNILFSCCVLGVTLWGSSSRAHSLETHLSSEQYQKILEVESSGQAEVDPVIEKVLLVGSRLLKWVSIANQDRDPRDKVRLNSGYFKTPATMESPKVYSPHSIEVSFRSHWKNISKDLRAVLSTQGEFPVQVPWKDAFLLENLRGLDADYQDAARWKWASSRLSYYRAQKFKDLRGYAGLQKAEWSEKRDFSSLAKEEKARIRSGLVGICLNQKKNLRNCTRDEENAEKENRLGDFYLSYIESARRLWNSYFTLHSVREDVEWNSSDPRTAHMPFLAPADAKVRDFLGNIEDEWKWKDWALKLRLGPFSGAVQLEFQPGVTPYVSDADRNKIVMDQNEALEEASAKWTIRHEFGHVLGFVDCYQEFYDDQSGAFVQFPLDEKDLMCAPQGKMNERLYLELKRLYFGGAEDPREHPLYE